MKRLVILISFIICFSFVSDVFGSDIASLIKDLGDKKKAKGVSYELAQIGKPAVPALIKALEGNNKYRKRYAARALREMGQDGADAIPALSRVFGDWDAQTREYAVEALGKMVQQADQVMPILRKATKDGHKGVRKKARSAINKLTAHYLTKPQVEQEVKTRLNRGETLGRKCVSVVLTKESSNKYTGFAEFEGGVKTRLIVDVDGNKIQYTFEAVVSEAANLQKTSREDFSKKVYQSPKPIQEEETKVQDEKISNEPNYTNLTVFDFPLTASPQEIINICEEKGIDIINGLISKKDFTRIVSNTIKQEYDEDAMSPASKEGALKILQEGKIKSFDVKYGGRNLVTVPRSLMVLLYTKYPVFEEHYDIYNTQFMFECKNLPNYMRTQRIANPMNIFFASFNQGLPKSYMISLRIYDRQSIQQIKQGDVVLDALINKFGVPKMYYNRNLEWYVFDQLEKTFSHYVRKPEGVVYPKAQEVLNAVISDVTIHGDFSHSPFSVCGANVKYLHHSRARFTLEWNYGNIKILCGVRFESYRVDEDMYVFTGGGWVPAPPTTYYYYCIDSINYIHWPTVEKLYDLYVKLSDASEKAEAKMREKGKKGF